MPDVICPKCGRSKTVTDETMASIAGKTIRCECKASFVVEDRGSLDFLTTPEEPVLARTAPPVPQSPSARSKDEKEAIAEKNVEIFRSRKESESPSVVAIMGNAVMKFLVWGATIVLVIVLTYGASSGHSQGLAILTLIGCFIAYLLIKITEVLIRITELLADD